MNNFLNPDEVIVAIRGAGMDRTHLLLLKKNEPIPETSRGILSALEATWERIVLNLPENERNALEEQMNSALEANGATERVKIADRSYLNLLDPSMADTGWMGIGPKLFQESVPSLRMGMKLEQKETHLTPDDPRAKNPEELAAEMSEMMFEPLYEPES